MPDSLLAAIDRQVMSALRPRTSVASPTRTPSCGTRTAQSCGDRPASSLDRDDSVGTLPPGRDVSRAGPLQRPAPDEEQEPGLALLLLDASEQPSASPRSGA